MEKKARITIITDRLELDLEYQIDNNYLFVDYLGITSRYYWNRAHKLDEEVNPDHIREMMDTINKSMWNHDFTMRILTMIPPMLHEYQRNDLSAVALDWL